MKRVDLSKLPQYLQKQRWFGGKAWPIKQVTVMDHATVEGDPTLEEGPIVAVIQVSYEQGQPELYMMPVTPKKDGSVGEALEDDGFLRALLRLIREESQVVTASGSLKGLLSSQAKALLAGLPPEPRVRRLAVEQTNTSVVFEDRVIMKVIRKLEPGLNPELEVGMFLARRGFKSSPALLGGLQLHGGSDATVAVLHAFVRSDGDGWKYTLDAFRAAPRPPPAFLSEMRALGGTVGALHVALASDPEDPAFGPEQIGREDLSRWSSSIIGELGVTLADAKDQVPEVAARREDLIARAQRLNQLEPTGQKIRLHGDLHLGQVLRTAQGWMLFDFEGEPARSFTFRREKHSPLKDVAGMLRSFSYAQAAIEFEGAAPGDRATSTRAAFLEGYRAAVESTDLLPKDETAVRELLLVLELEKALYELRYEIKHRPDWVRIPAKALLTPEGV